MRQRGMEWESSKLLLHLQFFPSLDIGAAFHGIPLDRYAILWCPWGTQDFPKITLSLFCQYKVL